MAKAKQYLVERMAEAEQRLAEMETLPDKSAWYYPSDLCRLAWPRDQWPTNEYYRVSGVHHLSITAPGVWGIPYGIYPRRITSWLTTQIKLNPNRKDRRIYFPSDLMQTVMTINGLKGAPNGKELTRFKEQLGRLMVSRICYWREQPDGSTVVRNRMLADDALLFKPAEFLKKKGLYQDYIEVNGKFWEESVSHGVILDKRILWGLGESCLAFDIYAWLTSRAYHILRFGAAAGRGWLFITWPQLQEQFGIQQIDGDRKDPDGVPALKVIGDPYRFRATFKAAVDRVLFLYRGVSVRKIAPGDGGVQFMFRRPSVLSTQLPFSDRKGKQLPWSQRPKKSTDSNG